MSIESDIITALSGVAGGRVYPVGEVPENLLANTATQKTFVAYRRLSYDPVMTLAGPEGDARSQMLFECWGGKTASTSAKQSALSLAASVRAAINAAAGLTRKYEVQVSGEDFEPETLEVMEPVLFDFWHAV